MTGTLATSRADALLLPDRLPQSAPVVERPPTRVGPTVLALLLAAAVFWGALGTWAAIAPIQSAVVATGSFRVQGSLPVVQHLEGGLIREVKVVEGEHVEAGQVLIELADTMSSAQDRILVNQLATALAREARVAAEVNRADAITPSPELAGLMSEDPSLAPILSAQETLLRSNNAMWEGQWQILEERIHQLTQQSEGLTSQQNALNNRLALVQDELPGLQKLFDQGLITKNRLHGRRDNEVALLGDISYTSSQLQGLASRISETREQMLQLRRDRAQRLAGEYQENQALLFDTRQRLLANTDVKQRHLIRAPVAGKVLDLRFTAPGEVIQDAEDILKLVPDGAVYIIEGKVRPEDVDQVAEGNPARVRLTAYNFRTTPPVEGIVTHVSPDSFVDPQTGQPFFKVHVRLDETELADLDNVQVAPGMPAQVMITTGEQTFANYILGPIFAGMNSALRESD